MSPHLPPETIPARFGALVQGLSSASSGGSFTAGSWVLASTRPTKGPKAEVTAYRGRRLGGCCTVLSPRRQDADRSIRMTLLHLASYSHRGLGWPF